MATDRLSLETQTFFNEVYQQTPAGELIHAFNHTALHPRNQPGNFFKRISPNNQGGRFKVSLASGTKGEFQRILRKLWRMEIPGKDHVESYLRDQYRRNHCLAPTTNHHRRMGFREFAHTRTESQQDHRGRRRHDPDT